jgi:ABC-type Fe3+-hydroxamate transport system substrate-binding protein
MIPVRNLSAIAALALAFSTGAAIAAPTQYPLVLENCGRTLTFEKAPSKTVSIGQSTTEILYLLGLSEKGKAQTLARLAPEELTLERRTETQTLPRLFP